MLAGPDYIFISLPFKMSATVLTPKKKGHPLIQSMLNTRKRNEPELIMRTCFSVEKKKKCLSVAIGNKLNSLIQITGEFYLNELSTGH